MFVSDADSLYMYRFKKVNQECQNTPKDKMVRLS